MSRSLFALFLQTQTALASLFKKFRKFPLSLSRKRKGTSQKSSRHAKCGGRPRTHGAFSRFPRAFLKKRRTSFSKFQSTPRLFPSHVPFLLKSFRVLFLPNVKRTDFAHPFYIVRAKAFSAHAFSHGKPSQSIRAGRKGAFLLKK